jgi:hypothetical protein
MRDRFPFWLLVCGAAVIAFSGCADVDFDPSEVHFRPYLGEQQNWPTSPGAFVDVVDGIPFYHGLPRESYTVLGQVTVANQSLHHLAEVAACHGANAVIIVDSQLVNTGSVSSSGSSGFIGPSTSIGVNVAQHSQTTTTQTYTAVVSAWLIQCPPSGLSPSQSTSFSEGALDHIRSLRLNSTNKPNVPTSQ